jgi:ADP-heptose:LPS heptosyltransferase
MRTASMLSMVGSSRQYQISIMSSLTPPPSEGLLVGNAVGIISVRHRCRATTSSMEPLPEQLVAEFLSAYRASQVYLGDRIARLAQLTNVDDSRVAESATRTLFAALVEPLADSFDGEAVSLYNRAFAQVIQICRRNPRAEPIDQELTQHGLGEEDDLIARADRVRKITPLTDSMLSSGKVRRVIILSRVTLGADVAITSVIIERMKLVFPAADIVVVGGAKAPELFGGDPRIQFCEIGYRRAGTTIERLLSWIDLLGCIRQQTDGLNPGEYLVVDPDSRLTQLGLLPIDRPSQLHESGYVFFPSREYGSATSRSLSELTSSWLDQLFGQNVTTHPRLSLQDQDIEAARYLINRIKHESRPIIAINFGVGENQFKRVGGDFEASLVSCLIQMGAVIVLDKGAGADELSRADAVVAEATRLELEGRRVRAVEINEQSLVEERRPAGWPDAEILVWKGRIGILAGLIGRSDLYIGYDSAGQHIAAALGVSCIDVFAGFSSQRMLERWRPSGRAEAHIVAVDTLRGGRATQGVLSEVLTCANEMLKTSTGAI